MYAIARLHYKNNNFILNGTKKPSEIARFDLNKYHLISKFATGIQSCCSTTRLRARELTGSRVD